MKMVFLDLCYYVYNKHNPVTRGILGLAPAAGEQWFIALIIKPWQSILPRLFYWFFKSALFKKVVMWR